nr:hypothetical protein [uncultured Gellertiella sp.]
MAAVATITARLARDTPEAARFGTGTRPHILPKIKQLDEFKVNLAVRNLTYFIFRQIKTT